MLQSAKIKLKNTELIMPGSWFCNKKEKKIEQPPKCELHKHRNKEAYKISRRQEAAGTV